MVTNMKKVTLEKQALDERIKEIQEFIQSKEYHLLPKVDMYLLDTQLFTMLTYKTVLQTRLENYIKRT